MTMPRGTWTGADDGNGARRTQQARNHRLFTCDMSHARCHALRWTYSSDRNASDCVGKTRQVPFHLSFLVVKSSRPSCIEALSNCADKIRQVPLCMAVMDR
jgi:hypothetical protein